MIYYQYIYNLQGTILANSRVLYSQNGSWWEVFFSASKEPLFSRMCAVVSVYECAALFSMLFCVCVCFVNVPTGAINRLIMWPDSLHPPACRAQRGRIRAAVMGVTHSNHRGTEPWLHNSFIFGKEGMGEEMRGVWLTVRVGGVGGWGVCGGGGGCKVNARLFFHFVWRDSESKQ